MVAVVIGKIGARYLGVFTSKSFLLVILIDCRNKELEEEIKCVAGLTSGVHDPWLADPAHDTSKLEFWIVTMCNCSSQFDPHVCWPFFH